MKKYLLIIISLLLVTVLWFLWQNSKVGDSTFNRGSKSNGPSVPTTDSWNIYRSSLNYDISYPNGYVIQPNGDYSILILKPMAEPGAGPTNFIFVSIVQPNMLDNEGDIYNYSPRLFKTLEGLDIGERTVLTNPDVPALDQWFTYTRVDDVVIDDHVAKGFENNRPWEFPGGTTEVRYVFKDGGYIYILGYYYGGEGVIDPIDAREAFGVISSFRLN